MQKITPFIWFDHEAQEAANFYVSVFNQAPGKTKESKIIQTTRYDAAGAEVSGMPEGSVMTVALQLAGQDFLALNGGSPPDVGNVSQLINPVSFVINCDTQEEVDYFWEKLSEGGEKGVCGWINKDQFGVTWQVVPTILDKLLADPDPTKAQRVMQAMLKMTKINISELQSAYAGK